MVPQKEPKEDKNKLAIYKESCETKVTMFPWQYCKKLMLQCTSKDNNKDKIK
jgi:hypothetical protein